MSTQNRRSSFSSSSTSSLAKRQAASSLENHGKVMAPPVHLAKKRAPLSNLTNQKSVTQNGGRISAAKGALVSCSTKISKAKKDSSTSICNTSLSGKTLPASLNAKSSVVSRTDTSFPKTDVTVPRIAALPVPCTMDVSPSRSEDVAVSMDETMSTCDSFKSPDVEYVDNDDVSAVNSIQRKTFSNLCLSEHVEPAENTCTGDILVNMETDEKIVNIDDKTMDPQFCTTIACDIYNHLRASEAKKRPSTDFMEKVQKDINESMRSILVDWLVEVAEEYRLVPDTLYLTVNYIDRYLSGNTINRQRLQLLGVACMMIAAKYEEICAPQVEEFCYITDNTYFKQEVLQMESDVLNYLKFEMTAPTAKSFLRRFVRAAQGMNEVASMQLECMANYIAELSLLEYSMLCHAPSLIAASAIFLAKFIMLPSRRPWDSTLDHYTQYKPSDLRECVEALHGLCCNTQNSNLPAVREKYSQHKYKFVAKKFCPPLLPAEYFHDPSN